MDQLPWAVFLSRHPHTQLSPCPGRAVTSLFFCFRNLLSIICVAEDAYDASPKMQYLRASDCSSCPLHWQARCLGALGDITLYITWSRSSDSEVRDFALSTSIALWVCGSFYLFLRQSPHAQRTESQSRPAKGRDEVMGNILFGDPKVINELFRNILGQRAPSNEV